MRGGQPEGLNFHHHRTEILKTYFGSISPYSSSVGERKKKNTRTESQESSRQTKKGKKKVNGKMCLSEFMNAGMILMKSFEALHN